MAMLTENDVVDAVCAHLVHEGYTIDKALTTKQRGIDIIAFSKGGRRLLVEAKGETSALLTSRLFGKRFKRSQVKTHVAMALLAAARLLHQHGSSADVVLAFPDEKNHREFVASIERPLTALGISILFVGADGRVSREAA